MSWFWTFVLCAALGVLYYLFMKKKKGKKPDNTGGPAAMDAAKPVVCPPGDGSPIFTGLRVLELCEVVATPVCCRMLADMGADVIKVERPGRGDLCRTLMAKEFQSHRPFGSGYEAVNTSKRGIVLDVKKTEDMVKFKKLLAECDVFVTNTRYPALQKLGLTYEHVHKEFPHVIWAHLSAYGTTGPCAQDPGFDTSSFWVNTGMSNSIHRPGLFSFYPAGFGDAVTGSTLFSGICMALTARAETGLGMDVSTSLFKVGIFCEAALVSQPPKPKVKKPIYQPITAAVTPLQGSYEVADNRYIHIGVQMDREEAAVESLEKVIPGVKGTSGAALHAKISAKVKDMSVEDAVNLMRSVGIPSLAHNSNINDIIVKGDHYGWGSAKTYRKHFAKDITHFHNLPFDCDASEMHEPRCRAPYLGQHTEDVLKNGWYERDEKSVLMRSEDNKSDPTEVFGRALLDGVTVVEWSDDGVAAATCTMFAADLGANVIKIEPEGGEFWRTKNPAFFETMNRGKSSLVTDDIHAVLANADIFVTNRPLTELREKGLDEASLKEKYPKLIFALSTPRGREGEEGNRSDYLIWWAESGFCNMLEPVPPGYPPQMGAIMTGVHLWAGLAAAIFHRRRTGEGQLVTANNFRSACFGNVFLGSFIFADEKFGEFVSQDPLEIEICRYFHALITFQCYKTKDDVWVQCIGTDLVGDGKKLLGALGLWIPVLKGLLPFLYKFATTKGSLFKKLRQVGFFLLPIVEKKFASMTYEEVTALFKKHNVWFCDVGVCDQMAYHPQVQALNILQGEGENPRVVCPPMTIGSCVKNNTRAPELNESM